MCRPDARWCARADDASEAAPIVRTTVESDAAGCPGCGAVAIAYVDTGGVSNGGTEAINGIIEKTRRLAHG